MKATMNLRLFLALAVALVAGYALYASMYWPFRTALFPRIIGVPLLIVALAEMALSAFGTEKQQEGHAVDFEMTANVDPVIAQKRTYAIFAWTLGFLALILLVGFPLAVPLFVFLYLKVAGREGWVLTLFLTALSWLFMKGLFDRLLHLPFPEGWIFSLWS
jgi:hypothetical protein